MLGLLLLLHTILRLVAGVLEGCAHVAAASDGVVLLTDHSLRALGGVNILFAGICGLSPRCLFTCEIVTKSTVISGIATDWLCTTFVLVIATRAVSQALFFQLITPLWGPLLCYRTRRNDVAHSRRRGDRGLSARLSRADTARGASHG